MNKGSALDALMAELLGDVGRLHDQVARLNTQLPASLAAVEAMNNQLLGDRTKILEALVIEASSQVIVRHAQRQAHCVNDVAMTRVADRLQDVAGTFGKLESRMAEVARAAAGASAVATADRKLKGVAEEVSSALARFDGHVEAISAGAKEAASAAHRVRASARRVEAWWLAFALLIAGALVAGMYLGHMTTTGAFQRVQAACVDAKEARK